MTELGMLLQQHIYLAVFLGAVLEGETAVVLAGFAAHQGYAPLWSVMLVAALSNTAVDQAFFALGYWRGEWLLQRLPRLRAPITRLQPRIYRHRLWLIVVLRFSYGLRVAGPIALGMARVPRLEFALLNIAAASLWAAIFTSLGYFLGLGLLRWLQHAGHYEHDVILAGLALGALAWWLASRRRRRP